VRLCAAAAVRAALTLQYITCKIIRKEFIVWGFTVDELLRLFRTKVLLKHVKDVD